MGALGRASLRPVRRVGERLWRQPVRWGIVAAAVLVGLALARAQLKTSSGSCCY
jgi:hypothetical protein